MYSVDSLETVLCHYYDRVRKTGISVSRPFTLNTGTTLYSQHLKYHIIVEP